MAPRRKVVWILGSGFSKSLGAPLLRDLLSARRRQLVDATFAALENGRASWLDTTARGVAYNIFPLFLPTATNSGFWSDAEEFLDLLDVACIKGSPKREFLWNVINQRTTAASIEQIRDAAILAVAAECSTYTMAADLQMEAWGPYLDWKRKLVKSGDAIITFNYDTVLECLGTNANADLFGAHTVVTPYGEPEAEKNGGVGTVPILKLHGSVTWAQTGDQQQTFKTLEQFSNFADPENQGLTPLIAAPGATKKKMCTGAFHDIWIDAKRALINADVIVFVGYRFPASDSHARSEILGAIARNSAPYLRIHTVLGPNLNEQDTVRLTNLLHHAARRSGKEPNLKPTFVPNVQEAQKQPVYDLIPQPLFAEDFLSVADDKELFGSRPDIIYRDASTPKVLVADDGTMTAETWARL